MRIANQSHVDVEQFRKVYANIFGIGSIYAFVRFHCGDDANLSFSRCRFDTFIARVHIHTCGSVQREQRLRQGGVRSRTAETWRFQFHFLSRRFLCPLLRRPIPFEATLRERSLSSGVVRSTPRPVIRSMPFADAGIERSTGHDRCSIVPVNALTGNRRELFRRTDLYASRSTLYNVPFLSIASRRLYYFIGDYFP